MKSFRIQSYSGPFLPHLDQNNSEYSHVTFYAVNSHKNDIHNAQKTNISVMDSFSKCVQVCLHFLKKFFPENFILGAVLLMLHNHFD